jgi:ribonuclease P/MRP protein subunit POP5
MAPRLEVWSDRNAVFEADVERELEQLLDVVRSIEHDENVNVRVFRRLPSSRAPVQDDLVDAIAERLGESRRELLERPFAVRGGLNAHAAPLCSGYFIIHAVPQGTRIRRVVSCFDSPDEIGVGRDNTPEPVHTPVKHLPKHLRPTWRYLGVGIESWPNAEIDRGAFQRELWYAAGNLYGDAVSAEADLRLLHFRYEDGEGEAVVRTRRGLEGETRAALACISGIGGAPVGLVVRGISGTVRGCEEKYIRGRPEESGETTVAFAGEERSAVARGDLIDVRVDGTFVGATDLDFRD